MGRIIILHAKGGSMKIRIEHKKLVRDKIPKKIRKGGDDCHVHELTYDELRGILPEKMNEEVKEFLSSRTPKQRLVELADMTEVSFKLVRMEGFSKEHLVRDIRNHWPKVVTAENHEQAELKRIAENLLGTVSAQERVTFTLKLLLIAIVIVNNDGFTFVDLDREINKKRNKNGKFDKGYFLDWAMESQKEQED